MLFKFWVLFWNVGRIYFLVLAHKTFKAMIKLYCESFSVQCIWLYVIIMSRIIFRGNLHSIVCLKVKELPAQTSLDKWSSDYLGTKWLWVWIPLLSLKFQIWRLLRASRSLTFWQTIECGFTLKLVRGMIITYD